MYKEIYIMLTTNCPNRCEYCYIKHDKTLKDRLSTDEVLSIIINERPDRVIFFGGEPLLEIDTISKILELKYNKFFNWNIRFQIVTSTCVNFEKLVELNKIYPLDEIQLSWDGSDNANRVDADGNEIQDKVYKNIMYAKANHMKFDIKCVISEDNVHLLGKIHKDFLYFSRTSNNLISGQFVIAHRTDATDEFYNTLKIQLPKIFTMDRFYKDNLNKIIAYLQKDKTYANCDAGKYIVITPDGRKTYCTALSQEYNAEFSQQELQEPCTNIDCINCKYNYLCDGGCKYERYKVYGDKWRENYLDGTCKLIKIYNDTIEKFLISLDPTEACILYNTIQKYTKYQETYHATLE